MAKVVKEGEIKDVDDGKSKKNGAAIDFHQGCASRGGRGLPEIKKCGVGGLLPLQRGERGKEQIRRKGKGKVIKLIKTVV